MATAVQRTIGRLVQPALYLLRHHIRYGEAGLGKRAAIVPLVFANRYLPPIDFDAELVFGARFTGNTRDAMQAGLYLFGVSERNLTHWIQSRLQPGDTFVDIGANVGYFTLLAATRVGPTGHVIAVEAHPQTIEVLRANVDANRFDFVRIVNVAVSDVVGTRTLYHPGDPNERSTVTSTIETPNFRPVGQIASAPLSEILQPEEKAAARIIKIDIEGAEWMAVAGIGPFADYRRADLEWIIEFVPDKARHVGKKSQEIVDIFKAAGYHAYRLDEVYYPRQLLEPGALRRPARLAGELERATNLIFSRTDAASL